MKTIIFELSNKDIDRAIKELKQYRNSIPVKQELLMAKLSSRGYEILIQKIGDLNAPYSQNELRSGASFQYSQKEARIFVVSDHAIYVEFGTGIVGARSSNPNNTVGYAYDINNHGDNGWYYYKDGQIHWTKGMPSRPFVHNTYIELKKEISSIIKEVFDDD